MLYLCDCYDGVNLSGALLHTSKTYCDLDSYLDLLVVTDKFIYDTVNKFIYETKVIGVSKILGFCGLIVLNGNLYVRFSNWS